MEEIKHDEIGKHQNIDSLGKNKKRCKKLGEYQYFEKSTRNKCSKSYEKRIKSKCSVAIVKTYCDEDENEKKQRRSVCKTLTPIKTV